MIFDNIFHRRRRAFWICLGLAALLMLAAVPENFSHAQGRYMREEWKVPDFYPRGFDGYGRIDAISKNAVVICDTGWKFAQRIQFATPRDPNAGISAFHVGDTVAYLVNDKREITSLWYIEFR